MTARVWGATAAERTAAYPCDRLLADADDVWFRAVTILARRPVVFRWLCQLKVAPYSYDWLDNFGRRSPRILTPGADRLAVGQRVMTIFDLVDFAPDEHLTLRMRRGTARAVYGDFAISYVVTDADADGGSRLVVKLLVRHARDVLHPVRRRAMPAGDLFMMRRQLHTLRALAERGH